MPVNDRTGTLSPAAWVEIGELMRRAADPAAAARDDLAARWHRGERVPAEAYLDHIPEVKDADTRALIGVEIRVRQELGEVPKADEYRGRFPGLSQAFLETATRHAAPDEPTASAAGGSPGPASPAFGPPAAPGEVGRLGKYRVQALLGRGAMGEVYRAFDEKLERPVALKVMLPRAAANPAAKDRFLREARSAARISNDHVVAIHEADQIDGTAYIALQLLHGRPLDEYLRRTDAVPVADVVRIGREIAAGLAAAHALGLVHRDIKPSNLWLEAPGGRVKILDFGLAKPLENPDSVELTATGAVVGTPAYMAPEQGRGQTVDGRADLFSLGCVLYRLAAGKPPFAGPTLMAVLMAIAGDEPTPIRVLNPAVPERLAALIRRLMAKHPADRPATAAAVAEELAAIGRGEEAAAIPYATADGPPPLPTRTGPGRRVGLLVAGLAVGIIAVVAVWYGLNRPDAPDAVGEVPVVAKADDPAPEPKGMPKPPDNPPEGKGLSPKAPAPRPPADPPAEKPSVPSGSGRDVPRIDSRRPDAQITLSLTPDGKARIQNPSIRPNGQLKFYVLVANTSALPEKTFQVELSGPGGLTGTKAMAVSRGTPVAVAFEPPPPPKKEAAKKDDPAAKKDEPPPPKAAEPPPGFPLPLTDLGAGNLAFQFQVKVFNTPREVGAAPAAEKTVIVHIKEPDSYLDPPAVSLTAGATPRQRNGVAAVVTASPPAKNDPLAVSEFVPPVDVALVFPPQLGVKTLELRAGTYRRNIFRPAQQARLAATDLPLTGAAESVKFHLDVDGFARAFVYTLRADRPVVADANKNAIDPDPRDDPAVRLFPVGASKRARDLSARVVSGALVQEPDYPTLPTRDLRFRIEVDNAPQDATLELLIDRTGDKTYANPDEKVALGLPRDRRVYLIPGGPDGAWVAANTVADHVAGVDVNDLRGSHRLQAVLRWMKTGEGGQKVAAEKTATYNLIVDDTPSPGREIDFDFAAFPRQLPRGSSLPVRLVADDPESGIERVTFVLGKPDKGGHVPPDTPEAEAVRQKFRTLWVGEIPVPAKDDPRVGLQEFDITAVVENGVGLTTMRHTRVRVEIVEPRK